MSYNAEDSFAKDLTSLILFSNYKDTDFSGNPGMMMSICNIITTKEYQLKLFNGQLKYKKLATKLYME